MVTREQRARVAALAHDFPRLWDAPTTKAKDKKRILRLVIKDITVERFGERKTAVLHVRWRAACEDIEVTLPPTLPITSGTPTRSSTACASWLASAPTSRSWQR